MRALLHPIAFVKAVHRTFFLEGISVQAAGLAYKSLLGMIPLGVVIAMIYAVVELRPTEEEPAPAAPTEAAAEAKTPSAEPAASPAADEDEDSDGVGRLREFIDQLFVPDKAREATRWIEDQVRVLRRNSTQVTVIGLFFLVATAFFLFRTIESVMNRIYRVRAARALGAQIITFWAFLTLGPLLLGASVYCTHLFSTRFSAENLPESLAFLAAHKGAMLRALPFLFTWIAFTLLNWLMPNTRVRLVPALLGALVAAGLWEGMKTGFNVFLTTYAGYESLYGSLATAVILLLWLFFSWYVALLGATISYHVQYPPGLHAWPGTESRPRLALALTLAVGETYRQGQPPVPDHRLAARFNCPVGALIDVALPLEAAGILARAETRRPGWVLTRAPETIPLTEIYNALGENLGDRPAGMRHRGADRFFRAVDEGVINALGSRTVADLFEDRGGPPPAALRTASPAASSPPDDPNPLENGAADE